MDWENNLEKKIRPKKSKNSKNQCAIAACEQKTTSEKANFSSNTVFSLYFKFRAKKFHAAKPLAFSLHFLFRRDQNHYSNLTSKIMKMFEQIFKKRQRPNTIQILWIVKKTYEVCESLTTKKLTYIEELSFFTNQQLFRIQLQKCTFTRAKFTRICFSWPRLLLTTLQ